MTTPTETMNADDVLAAISGAMAVCDVAHYPVLVGRLHSAHKSVAAVYAERDALRSVLREFQDGRRISNPHTRQVARDIEQQAIARSEGGAK